MIKPRGAFSGQGVIIVNCEHLDSTLEYILSRSNELQSDPDNSYKYWYYDGFDSLLVEESVESDPISVAHLDNKIYQPTMRVAFILVYNDQTIDVEFLGGYWLLPYFAISEDGTLNDRHKAYCKIPYFSKVDPDVLSKVYQQLSIALPLLYEQMLLDE